DVAFVVDGALHADGLRHLLRALRDLRRRDEVRRRVAEVADGADAAGDRARLGLDLPEALAVDAVRRDQRSGDRRRLFVLVGGDVRVVLVVGLAEEVGGDARGLLGAERREEVRENDADRAVAMFLRRLRGGVKRCAEAADGDFFWLAEAEEGQLARIFVEQGDQLVAAAGEAGFIDDLAPRTRFVAFGDENE